MSSPDTRTPVFHPGARVKTTRMPLAWLEERLAVVR